MYKYYSVHNQEALNISHLDQFGLIQDRYEIEILNKINKVQSIWRNTEVELDKRYLIVFKIVNSYCYCLNSEPEILKELNPTLELNCAKDSFWSVNETEFKIDVEPQNEFDFDIFSSFFENTSLNNFVSGKMDCTNSFERYLKLKSNRKEDYIVLLGKKNWPKKPAIKYKKDKHGKILTREVKILELNQSNFIKSVEEIIDETYEKIDIRRFPAFYKRKDRVVFIDKEYGFVFGVSYSEAKTLDKNNHKFNQIELEFWSQIVLERDFKNIDWYKVDVSHKKLIDTIEETLLKNKFKYNAPGGRKYEWLSSIGHTNRKFKIKDIL